MANPALNRAFKNTPSNDMSQYYNSNGEYQSSNMAPIRKMSMEGVINKVLGMFGLVVVSAAIVWFSLPMLLASGLFYPIFLGSMLLGLGLGLYASLSKEVRKGAMLGYAVVQGVFIGTFSAFLNSIYPGIVIQAVIATLATAGTIFFAWKVGWIKVTDRFMKFMMFALVGYLIFGLINLGFAVFAGLSIYDSGFGWIIALLGCGLAAFSLAMDFQLINKGIAEGVDESFEWRGAFGLTVTLLWLYVEILRLLAITRE